MRKNHYFTKNSIGLEIYAAILSISNSSKSSFFDKIDPTVDFPAPGMPTNTRFFFDIVSFYIDIT